MRRTVEIFFLPEEAAKWIRCIVEDLALWMVLEKHGEPPVSINVSDIAEEMFLGEVVGVLTIYVGDPNINDPVWVGNNPSNTIDFENSCAIQITPPLLDPKRRTLLQGFFGIMKQSYYHDKSKEKALQSLFCATRKVLTRFASNDYSIVQVLPNGQKKRWTDIVVGKTVPQAVVQGFRLKQFAEGEVEFFLEPSLVAD